MRYTSEVDGKEVLGIESWRNLSKDKFLRFLSALPEMDKEVALQLIGQIPEITASAKAVLEDAAKAYDSLVDSNARSMEMVHQIDTAVLAILKDELDKDLTPEERMRVLEQVRDVSHADTPQGHREQGVPRRAVRQAVGSCPCSRGRRRRGRVRHCEVRG